MPLFDAYLMVDWSASSTPRRGNDSIWYTLTVRTDAGLRQRALVNPSTRFQAARQIEALLASWSARGLRILAGFDFPNAYPAGFAQAAGFAGAPWRAVWDGLAGLIEDGEDNANNRFGAAGRLNARISGGHYPFWGHHPAHRYDNLGPRKPRLNDAALSERRLCERFVRSAKPCWQLYGNGSVGGQALLGIPVQRGLRDAPLLAGRIRVWPFETGLRAPEPAPGDIVLTEVYPSMFGIGPREGRDRWQVRNTARWLARRDDAGLLAADFAGPEALTASERRLIEAEEGWILGAGTFDPTAPAGDD